MKKLLYCLCAWCSLLTAQEKLVPNDKMALLRGVVTNFKGKPLGNEIVLFVNDKTKSFVKANTNAAGKFEVLVPVNAVYMLKYKSFTMDMEYTKMEIPADKDAIYDVEIHIDPPRDIVLENVYFDTGKSTLKSTSHKALNDLAEVLTLKKTMIVEIQGHTDNVGQEDANLQLSQARAEAVKKYLVSKGISENRVVAKGYGQTRPVADNATEEGRTKNRRTSLKVIKE